jgi:hypothetical protein
MKAPTILRAVDEVEWWLVAEKLTITVRLKPDTTRWGSPEA